MQVVATNVSVWLRTVVKEIMIELDSELVDDSDDQDLPEALTDHPKPGR